MENYYYHWSLVTNSMHNGCIGHLVIRVSFFFFFFFTTVSTIVSPY